MEVARTLIKLKSGAWATMGDLIDLKCKQPEEFLGYTDEEFKEMVEERRLDKLKKQC